MKKYYFLIIVALIFGLVLTGCSLLSNISQVPANEQSGITYLTKHTEDVPFESILWAGQDINVGTVNVWNDGVELHVTYNTTGGWVLTETHLAVATALDDIPQKNGNPIPGKFQYQCCYVGSEWVFLIKNDGAPGATCDADGNANATLTEVEYIIPLSEIGEGVDCEELLYIAAHASLLNLDNIVGYVPDTGDPGDPIYQEETGWGDNGLGFPGNNWATYFEYSVQCPPCIVTYPETGTAYIGYEDWTNGDFDYNDFGMNFSVEELYEGPCEQGMLKEVTMTFEAVIFDSGMRHKIHIATPFTGSYQYTVTRNAGDPVGVDETPSGGPYSGSGPLDVTLFNTFKYTWPQKQIGEIVTVHVVLDVPEVRPVPATLRSYDVGSGDFYDLDPIMAFYDPWEVGTLYSSLFHIEDTQVISDTSAQKHIGSSWPNLGTIIPVNTEVPMIIVSKNTDWVPPWEDTTITGPYLLFDDFYTTGSPANWYDTPNLAALTGAGGFAW